MAIRCNGLLTTLRAPCSCAACFWSARLRQHFATRNGFESEQAQLSEALNAPASASAPKFGIDFGTHDAQIQGLQRSWRV
jgi:hypothetical protein